MNPDLHNNFTTFLRSLSGYSWWQVAIQLLLIGAVVFWIIRFLEGTRGVRMLKGIAVVLIGFYLIVNLVGKVFKLDPIIFLYEKVPPLRLVRPGGRLPAGTPPRPDAPR